MQIVEGHDFKVIVIVDNSVRISGAVIVCHVAGVKFSSHWEEFVDGLSDEAVALSLISGVGVVARFGGGWRFRGAVLEV